MSATNSRKPCCHGYQSVVMVTVWSSNLSNRVFIRTAASRRNPYRLCVKTMLTLTTMLVCDWVSVQMGGPFRRGVAHPRMKCHWWKHKDKYGCCWWRRCSDMARKGRDASGDLTEEAEPRWSQPRMLIWVNSDESKIILTNHWLFFWVVD